MIDDLQYWQRVLANAQNHLQILNEQEIQDLLGRKACSASIEEATNKINDLS